DIENVCVLKRRVSSVHQISSQYKTRYKREKKSFPAVVIFITSRRISEPLIVRRLQLKRGSEGSLRAPTDTEPGKPRVDLFNPDRSAEDHKNRRLCFAIFRLRFICARPRTEVRKSPEQTWFLNDG